MHCVAPSTPPTVGRYRPVTTVGDVRTDSLHSSRKERRMRHAEDTSPPVCPSGSLQDRRCRYGTVGRAAALAAAATLAFATPGPAQTVSPVSWSAPESLGSQARSTAYDLRYSAGTADPTDEADWTEEGETDGPSESGSTTSADAHGADCGQHEPWAGADVRRLGEPAVDLGRRRWDPGGADGDISGRLGEERSRRRDGSVPGPLTEPWRSRTRRRCSICASPSSPRGSSTAGLPSRT